MPFCTSTMLEARLGHRNFVETNRYVTLILTNTSGSPCKIRGFTGLQLVDGDRLLETTVERHGTPRTVTLSSGGWAWERLHWTSEPAADEGGSTCQPTASTLQVYPPYRTRPITAFWNNGPVCQHGRIWINPIMPSSTFPH